MAWPYFCVLTANAKPAPFSSPLSPTDHQIPHRTAFLQIHDNSVLTSVNCCVYRFTINKQRGDFAVQFQLLVALNQKRHQHESLHCSLRQNRWLHAHDGAVLPLQLQSQLHQP
jgi:hypothetical protein